MNCLSNAPSYAAALFKRASHVISRSYLPGSSIPTSISYRASQNAAACSLGVKFLATDRVRCYSSKRGSKTSSKLKNLASSSQPEEPNQDKNTFFVVRKGDLVGVYRNSSDCLAQVGSSLCDSPVSVYKGHTLPKDTEDYLASLGLKNAIYTIRAADLKDDMFGNLSPFSLQEPASVGSDEPSPVVVDEAISQTPADWIEKKAELADNGEKDKASSGDSSSSCTLSFDGASKGNPGKAGARAVLRSVDGNLGLWKVKNENLATLHEVVTELKHKFPDPIPEFADAEIEKFRSHMLKRLAKKELCGDSIDEVVGICTNILSTFLHSEYGGPGTSLVIPFIDMADTIKEKGLPGGPQAARIAYKWAQNHVDNDWNQWNGES